MSLSQLLILVVIGQGILAVLLFYACVCLHRLAGSPWLEILRRYEESRNRRSFDYL